MRDNSLPISPLQDFRQDARQVTANNRRHFWSVVQTKNWFSLLNAIINVYIFYLTEVMIINHFGVILDLE